MKKMHKMKEKNISEVSRPKMIYEQREQTVNVLIK